MRGGVNTALLLSVELTLEGAVLRAAGGDEVERHVGCPTDVLMRKSPTGTFVASTHNTLADKVSPPDHEDEQDDSDDWADGVGPSVRDATGGRRHELCTWRRKTRKFTRKTTKKAAAFLLFEDLSVCTTGELV